MFRQILLIVVITTLFIGCGLEKNLAKQTLANVSSEPTREFYEDYNVAFKKYWEAELGNGELTIKQIHGASGKQAEAVAEGKLSPDVVTLTIAYDITKIRNAGLIRGGWRLEFPNNSSPMYSTIVFLVRNGNPKNIRDWDDLVREDVKIIAPNPKTSGGARWNYLTAWEYGKRKFNGDEEQIIAFMKKFFKNVVSMDEGVRESRENFKKGAGDILIAWESEALRFHKEYPEECEIIVPSISIVAELPVAVVDNVADSHRTRELATEYLNHLYSLEGQEIAARNYYRPRNAEIMAKYQQIFEPMELFTIDEAFGGWVKSYKEHFADGGTFDRVRGQ